MGAGLHHAVRRLAKGWSMRSVAIELEGGGLCVFSPTAGLSPEGLPDRVELLLAPNHYHWLGVGEWRAAFPDAGVIAGDVARPRLADKLGAAPLDLGALRARLPARVTVLEPAGTANGEVWLEVEDGARTWVVCDAFFNEPAHPTGLFGLGARVTGTTAGLRLGQTWKYVALGDRAAYKAWTLDRLASAPPARVVMSHGDVLEGDGVAERLAALVRARL